MIKEITDHIENYVVDQAVVDGDGLHLRVENLWWVSIFGRYNLFRPDGGDDPNSLVGLVVLSITDEFKNQIRILFTDRTRLVIDTQDRSYKTAEILNIISTDGSVYSL